MDRHAVEAMTPAEALVWLFDAMGRVPPAKKEMVFHLFYAVLHSGSEQEAARLYPVFAGSLRRALNLPPPPSEWCKELYLPG